MPEDRVVDPRPALIPVLMSWGASTAQGSARPADHTGMSDEQDHLTVLVPPCPAMDLSTITSGLHDAAARESVARLLRRELAA